MIYYNTRYDLAGEVAVVPTRNGDEMTKTVYRVFPSSQSGVFGQYVWRDGDRIDKIANFFLGNASRWWEIMDLNPEIHSPAEIAPGMSIRVPISKVVKS
jgi:hypothetical protein